MAANLFNQEELDYLDIQGHQYVSSVPGRDFDPKLLGYKGEVAKTTKDFVLHIIKNSTKDVCIQKTLFVCLYENENDNNQPCR